MKIPGIGFRCRGFFSVLLSDALAKAFQQETYIRHIGLVLFHRSSRIRVEQSHDCGKQYGAQNEMYHMTERNR